MRSMILLALLLALAPMASANLVDGTTPGMRCRYGQYGAGLGCWEICALNATGGAPTECIANFAEIGAVYDCSVTYVNVQTSCTPPATFKCSYAAQGTTGSPTVWTEFGTLTDPATGISELPLAKRPLSYMKCEFPAVGDADCTDLVYGLVCGTR